MGKVLFACEQSQICTIAFREKGIEAYSCDILPAGGFRPEWHIQRDCLQELQGDYSLKISFPPCTDLANSGARWFEQKRLRDRQRNAIEFFLKVWELSDVVENPKNIFCGGRYLKRHFPDIWERAQVMGFPFNKYQVIQPYEYGHGETKATCLWIKNLPDLVPTNKVEGREARIHKMSPGPARSMYRSLTYPGIAEAMAEQWGKFA